MPLHLRVVACTSAAIASMAPESKRFDALVAGTAPTREPWAHVAIAMVMHQMAAKVPASVRKEHD